MGNEGILAETPPAEYLGVAKATMTCNMYHKTQIVTACDEPADNLVTMRVHTR